MVSLLYEQYEGNPIQCARIAEFLRSYQPSDAIMWYTKEPFIYQILNKALRIQDIDTVFAFRFLIRDIYNQLENEQLEYLYKLDEENSESPLDKTLHTYRGQKMYIDEFENFKFSEGKYISINAFFSTSKNKQVSLAFIQTNEDDDPSQVSVLFEVESAIDAPFSTRPFADIHHLSQFDMEEEVLFMIGIVFEITKVYYDDQYDHVWIVKLVLCDERNDELNEIFHVLKQQTMEEITNIMSIGNILLDMGRFDKAEVYYQRYLKSLTPDNSSVIASVYKKLAKIAYIKGDHSSTALYFGTMTEMIIKRNSHLDSSQIEFLRSVCDHFIDTNKPMKFDKVLQYYPEINMNSIAFVQCDDLSKIEDCKHIGNILRTQKRFDESLAVFQKCLNTEYKFLPNNHPELAKTYEFIGDLYTLKKDYGHALESYQSACEIKSQSLPNAHYETAQLYIKIGDVCNALLEDYQLALNYYNIALDICLKIFPSTHTSVINLQDAIKEIKIKLNSTIKDSSNE